MTMSFAPAMLPPPFRARPPSLAHFSTHPGSSIQPEALLQSPMAIQALSQPRREHRVDPGPRLLQRLAAELGSARAHVVIHSESAPARSSLPTVQVTTALPSS